MKAKVGDFLVVKGTTTERHDQHGEIIEVRSQDGSPRAGWTALAGLTGLTNRHPSWGGS
jgi:hypothetical protein